MQPLVVLAEVTALLIKKESQQEFNFSSFQNQRQKLTTGATWLKDKMAKMVLQSKKIKHIYDRNIFMLQIYTEPLVVRDTP